MIKVLLKKGLLASFISSLFIASSSSVLAMEDNVLDGTHSSARLSTPRTQQEANNIVTSITKMVYGKINKNWTYVAPSHQMQTESTHWQPKWRKGLSMVDGKKQETNLPTLILKTTPDKLMEALEDLIEKPASFECTIALTTAKIFCLRELLGPEYFNHYAAAFYKVLGNSKNWDIEEFFHELPLQFLKTEQGKAIPGSITYITNIPLYAHFKPNGNGRGSNVFCTAQDRYLGFSAIYKTGPQPLDVIEYQDLALFSKQEDVEKDHGQHERISQRFTTYPSSFIEMRRRAQEKVDLYQFFDLQEINKFIETDELYI